MGEFALYKGYFYHDTCLSKVLVKHVGVERAEDILTSKEVFYGKSTREVSRNMRVVSKRHR